MISRFFSYYFSSQFSFRFPLSFYLFLLLKLFQVDNWIGERQIMLLWSVLPHSNQNAIQHEGKRKRKEIIKQKQSWLLKLHYRQHHHNHRMCFWSHELYKSCFKLNFYATIIIIPFFPFFLFFYFPFFSWFFFSLIWMRSKSISWWCCCCLWFLYLCVCLFEFLLLSFFLPAWKQTNK